MRAQIFDALKALLAAVPGVLKVEEKARHHKQIDPAGTPLIFLLTGDEDHSRRVGGQDIPGIGFTVVVTVAETLGPDKKTITQSAGRVLIGLQDAIDAKLAGSPLQDGRQTLGGLVYDCFISGVVETDAGELGSKAQALIPIVVQPYG